METTVIERIINIKKNEGLTNEKLSSRTNISVETIKSMFSKKTNPNLETVQKIYSAFPHYSLEWIICGKGEMIKTENQTTDVKYVDNDFLLDRIEKLAIRNNELEKEIELLKNKQSDTVVVNAYPNYIEKALMVAEKKK